VLGLPCPHIDADGRQDSGPRRIHKFWAWVSVDSRIPSNNDPIIQSGQQFTMGLAAPKKYAAPSFVCIFTAMLTLCQPNEDFQ